MAGTLWVADALFAFANAGARAFHLHWGLGGLPYQGGSPNVGVQTNFDYNVSLCFGAAACQLLSSAAPRYMSAVVTAAAGMAVPAVPHGFLAGPHVQTQL